MIKNFLNFWINLKFWLFILIIFFRKETIYNFFRSVPVVKMLVRAVLRLRRPSTCPQCSRLLATSHRESNFIRFFVNIGVVFSVAGPGYLLAGAGLKVGLQLR